MRAGNELWAWTQARDWSHCRALLNAKTRLANRTENARNAPNLLQRDCTNMDWDEDMRQLEAAGDAQLSFFSDARECNGAVECNALKSDQCGFKIQDPRPTSPCSTQHNELGDAAAVFQRKRTTYIQDRDMVVSLSSAMEVSMTKMCVSVFAKLTFLAR